MTHIEKKEFSYRELVLRKANRLFKYSSKDNSLYLRVGNMYTTSVFLDGSDIQDLVNFLEEVKALRKEG